MQKMGLTGVHRLTLALAGIVVLAPAVGASRVSSASNESDQGEGYAIGHATLVLTDTSRNPDGSTPVTTAGRPLYLHLWYPTRATTSAHVTYTWNNPIYNQNPGGTVYPGFPDLPALTFNGSPSFNPVREGAPLERASFPLLVASHGLETAAAKTIPDTLET